jgi:hypothetical protein
MLCDDRRKQKVRGKGHQRIRNFFAAFDDDGIPGVPELTEALRDRQITGGGQTKLKKQRVKKGWWLKTGRAQVLFFPKSVESGTGGADV